MDTIVILDFGSQYTQLIARRVREQHVYCELLPWDSAPERVQALKPKGVILSGGPDSVYAQDAPQAPSYIFESKLPVLGICYGLQAMTRALGGQVAPATAREYGPATVTTLSPNLLLPKDPFPVWMSHGDRIEAMPPGFTALAKSPNSPFAALGDLQRNYFGVQFHPESILTPEGKRLLENFVTIKGGNNGH